MGKIEFICLGSSSSGNAYVFRKNNECVLVECGFEWKDLVKRLMLNNVDLQTIKAVVVTHEHSDHSRSLPNFVGMGIKCFVPNSSKFAIWNGIRNNVVYLADKAQFEVVEWLKMISFNVVHDVVSYGFIFLDTETEETILFINDTKCFDFCYKDYSPTYIFIECNHVRKQLEMIMQKALDEGNESKVFKYKRQSAYHMSLLACKKFLRHEDLHSTQGIFLMHMSSECAQPEIMKQEIIDTFKIPTFVCCKNGGIR